MEFYDFLGGGDLFLGKEAQVGPYSFCSFSLLLLAPLLGSKIKLRGFIPCYNWLCLF